MRARRSPEELSREFEPSARTIRNWAKHADIDEWVRSDGLTTDEREELRRLKRKVRQLKLEREILRKAAAWFARESNSIHREFEFVRRHQAEFPVRTMCRVLGLSTSGYYAWLDRPPSARATANEALVGRVREIPTFSRESYAAPRMYADLRDEVCW